VGRKLHSQNYSSISEPITEIFDFNFLKLFCRCLLIGIRGRPVFYDPKFILKAFRYFRIFLPF
jgi:hypothetical protein